MVAVGVGGSRVIELERAPTLSVEAWKSDMREVKYLSVESVISPPTLRKFSVWATNLKCFMESLEDEYAVSEDEVMEKFSASVREPTC